MEGNGYKGYLAAYGSFKKNIWVQDCLFTRLINFCWYKTKHFFVKCTSKLYTPNFLYIVTGTQITLVLGNGCPNFLLNRLILGTACVKKRPWQSPNPICHFFFSTKNSTENYCKSRYLETILNILDLIWIIFEYSINKMLLSSLS